MADVSNTVRPAWVQDLEQAFGGPNQSAFGTAVFFERIVDASEATGGGGLEQRALAWYQFFCGATWEKFGPDNWRATWKSVYVRANDSDSIVDALANLQDPQAQMSASTMLEGASDPLLAKNALKQAFDSPEIMELQVFRIGDGNAMSGLLIAGRHKGGDSAYVAFLLD